MVTTMSLDHCPAVIAADYALSERLGAEMLAEGCEALPRAERPATRRTWVVHSLHTDLQTGAQTLVTKSEAA